MKEVKEAIDFLSEAKNHTYSSEDKYYLSKVIDTLYHMKELGCFNYLDNIEEKAKRFDEVLAIAKECITYVPDEAVNKYMLNMFPELKESDDERIRKALIRFHKSTIDVDGIKGEDILAWLEKQGEQRSTYKVEPKFHEGDWITNNATNPAQISSIKDGMYFTHNDTIGGDVESIDKEYHLWTIADAKAGDVLYLQKDGKEHIIIYKGVIKERFRTFVSAYCAYNGIVDAFCFADVSRYADIAYGGIMPATKEQRDTLMKAMADDGYEWDADKKELKKIEQKPTDLPNGEDYGIDGLYAAVDILQKTLGKVDGYQTDDGILEHECAISAVKKLCEQKSSWSEEDENHIQHISDFIMRNRVGDTDAIYRLEQDVNWLKSLKDRYTWKPSDEFRFNPSI